MPKAVLLIRRVKYTDICYALVIDFDDNYYRYTCDELEFAKKMLNTICYHAGPIEKFEEYENDREVEIGYMCEKVGK